MVIGLFAVDAASRSVAAAVGRQSHLVFPGADVILTAIAAGDSSSSVSGLYTTSLLNTVFRQSAMAISLSLAYALVVELLIFQPAAWVRRQGGSADR